jgi:carbonic anhydrase/acetyltransferase-like protein (isoleucine patch superfamily)
MPPQGYPVYSYDGKTPQIDPSCFVAPTAVLIGQVTMATNSSVWFHTVVRADINRIEIGLNSNIQDGCLLHVTNRHPLIIEDNVTVGHGVILHGCHVEPNCLIAMGAIVLDGAHLEENCLIAAGSVVAPNTRIPANSIVMGVPGKVVRPVRPEDRERIARGWRNYVGYAANYRLAAAQQATT